MITMTSRQAATYEYIKTGQYTKTQITQATGFPKGTIESHLTCLMRDGMVKRTKVRKVYRYKAIDQPYEIGIRTAKQEEIVSLKESDPLLYRRMVVTLTTDQEYYLEQHRNQKRSILAKRLGLTKPQLLYVLERL